MQAHDKTEPSLVAYAISTKISHACSTLYEPGHEISNNVVCATSIASDQPAHTCSLIRAVASCLNIL